MRSLSNSASAAFIPCGYWLNQKYWWTWFVDSFADNPWLRYIGGPPVLGATKENEDWNFFNTWLCLESLGSPITRWSKAPRHTIADSSGRIWWAGLLIPDLHGLWSLVFIWFIPVLMGFTKVVKVYNLCLLGIFSLIKLITTEQAQTMLKATHSINHFIRER